MEYKTYNNIKIPQNLSPEKQALVDEIARNYIKQDKIINTDYMNNMARIGLGTGLSVASFLPVFNVPYVGTGLGGAMYDAGQAIVEGDKGSDIAKRAGRGFLIGETVGAVPYVGKAASKTKAGQAVLNSAPAKAVGNALDSVAEKVAANPAVQKAYDALMSDVKAFNPNKQIAYHGSPYDFEKFSNEAIGTGEGAQAHGMGHYAALDKDVADKNYRQALTGDDFDNMKYFYKNAEVTNKREKAIIASILENGKENVIKVREKNLPRYKYDEKEYNQKLKELDFVKNINENLIRKDTDKGQLYELSVPKDDVMLREDATFAEQPKAVQDALQKIANKQGEWGNKEYLNFWEIPEDEFYNQAIKGNATGKEIQNLINNYAKDNFAATSILRDNGIKGISYNGGIDGEARVIFNPDDIDIVRKYYNQPTLKDIYNKFINSGTFAGALTNP